MSTEPQALRITFSVNEYDENGGRTGQGVYLHIGPVRVHVGTVANVRNLAKQLEDIASEIEDPDAFFARSQ